MRPTVPSLALVALIAAACGNGAGAAPVPPGQSVTTSSTTTAPPATTSSVPTSSTTAPPATPPSTSSSSSSTTTTVPTAAQPESPTPTSTLAATAGVPEEGGRLNEGGVPITLDETAALACANAEFARDSIELGNLDQARRDLGAAADRAEPSTVPDIADAADQVRDALEAPDPQAVVEAFLDICVEHGHQI